MSPACVTIWCAGDGSRTRMGFSCMARTEQAPADSKPAAYTNSTTPAWIPYGGLGPGQRGSTYQVSTPRCPASYGPPS